MVDRKLKLKINSSSFHIPDDNWYVTRPAVRTRGLGMDDDKVADGLVNGLYGSKARIEREIVSAVPAMVNQLEEKLELQPAEDFVAALWPLPVYKPRVRVWPAAVSTDEKGVSIVLGVTAAAIDPQTAPQTPHVVAPVGLTVAQIAQSENFQVGLAPQLLSPLAKMLIDQDVARLHVLDAPIKKLAPLADPEFLAQVIPDLKRYGENLEIWSELVLTQPLAIQKADVQATKEAPSVMELSLPRVLVSLAIKPDSSAETWTPYAEFEFSVIQRVRPELTKPTFSRRNLALKWMGGPQVVAHARFAPGFQPATRQSTSIASGRFLSMAGGN